MLVVLGGIAYYNRINIFRLLRCLEDELLVVGVAHRGVEARALVAREAPDRVLLDSNCPTPAGCRWAARSAPARAIRST